MAHDHEIYMILADTAMELRDIDSIHKYASPLEKLASRDNHGLYLAIAQRAIGVGHRLAGEHEEAQDHLRQALGRFTKVGARWQIGRTLFELGELQSARSNEKAREYYSQALGAFEEMQAVPHAERTRLVLNSLG
jgi:tetratricopeptide (TPR) repeat protein